MALTRPRPAVLLLAGWFLLVLGYALYVHAGFVSRDQWHFLDMVDHYLSGTLDWHELWHSHSEHVKPGYYLLFLWNAKYLSLNLMVEIVAGILLLGAEVVLVGREFAVSLGGAWRSPQAGLALFTIGAVLMSFNQWANYAYSLLALGGFGGMLLQLAFFAGFARLLRRDLTRAGLAGLYLVLALGILGFSGARSPAVVGTALACLVLQAWLEPAARPRLLRKALPVAVAGCAGIALYLALLNSDRTSGAHLLGNLEGLAHELLSSIGYLAGLSAQSMLDIVNVRHLLHLAVPELLLASLGLAALAWSLWRYFAAQHWRKTWMPLMLISYSALFGLEVLVGRFASGIASLQGSSVPRYVFDAHLWMAGVAWIAALEWTAADRRSRARPAAAVIAFLLALELVNLYTSLRAAPFLARASARAEATMEDIAAGRADASALPAWMCPGDNVCQRGMEILEHYRLNAAREASAPAAPAP